MEERSLFAGIFIDNGQVFASVINGKGKPLLCNRYQYDCAREDFPEILDHLRHFADLNGASLLIAFADRWDAPAPMDPLSPLWDEVMRVSSHDLSETNLARSSYGPDSHYDKPKLIALLAALRHSAARQASLNPGFPTRAVA